VTGAMASMCPTGWPAFVCWIASRMVASECQIVACVAHSDMSLVLRKIDLSGLVQVQAAQAIAGAMPSDPLQVAKDIQGRRVLTTYAPIPPLGWLVFVELPVDEAYRPLYATIRRMTLLLLAALGLALLAGVFLARMMAWPIHALQAVACSQEQRGSQLAVSQSSDELEMLADQFNEMAEKLHQS